MCAGYGDGVDDGLNDVQWPRCPNDLILLRQHPDAFMPRLRAPHPHPPHSHARRVRRAQHPRRTAPTVTAVTRAGPAGVARHQVPLLHRAGPHPALVLNPGDLEPHPHRPRRPPLRHPLHPQRDREEPHPRRHRLRLRIHRQRLHIQLQLRRRQRLQPAPAGDRLRDPLIRQPVEMGGVASIRTRDGHPLPGRDFRLPSYEFLFYSWSVWIRSMSNTM